MDRRTTVPPAAGGPANSGGEAPRAVFAVGRALGDLRRGGVVVLDDGERGASALLAAECATPERLARLAALPGAELLHPVEANEVFARLAPAALAALEAAGFGFHRWPAGGEGAIRLVASWCVEDADIDRFLACAASSAPGR